MKAWVLHGINDIRYETVDAPGISAHEVLVSVKAAGICGSDIPRIYQTGAHTHPLIPGHEFAGVVVRCGEKADQSLAGARVGVFPLIPCKQCVPCKKHQYEMCRNYSYLGSRKDGGFAELVAVPAANVIRLPDSVSFEEAAMLEPMAVAVHAMRRITPATTDTVTVCGLGTIGLLLVMFLREAGVENILVIGNKEFQKHTVLERLNLHVGEDNYCDSRTQDIAEWIADRTGGKGTDVFFECVGKNDTFSSSVDCTAPAGRICLVGNPYSDMELEKPVYWKILRNQLNITGTWNSSFSYAGNDNSRNTDDWEYVLERLAAKRIEPGKLISHRFALADLERGLSIMRDKSEDYIKVMNIL